MFSATFLPIALGTLSIFTSQRSCSVFSCSWTEALTNFNSENPQLAEVEPGDELPYVPRHQGAISAGYEDERVYRAHEKFLL